MEKVFIRFGELPENKKSKRFCGEVFEGYEKGVSVYEGIIDKEEIKLIMPSLTASACVSLSGCLKRKMYIVKGKIIGKGKDGEPLLKNLKVIKPKDEKEKTL